MTAEGVYGNGVARPRQKNRGREPFKGASLFRMTKFDRLQPRGTHTK